MNKKQCYFCQASKNATEFLYVFDSAGGQHVPMQVPVCKECKAEYEATFPNYRAAKEVTK